MKVVYQALHGVHALHKPPIDLKVCDEIRGRHEKRVSLFEAQLKPLSHQESERLARHTLEDRPVPPGRIRHGGRIGPQRPVRTALAYSTSSVSMTPLGRGLISTRAALSPGHRFCCQGLGSVGPSAGQSLRKEDLRSVPWARRQWVEQH